MGFEGEAIDYTDQKSEYRSHIKRKISFMVFCLFGLFIAVGLSVTVGAADIGFFESYKYIFDHIMGVTYEFGSSDWLNDYVIWNSRVPRALFGIIAGAGLAVAGCSMQSVMNNPLADAYTTGISSGAMFGVSVSIILGMSLTSDMVNTTGIMVNAFLFSLVPMTLMVLIAPKTRTNPSTLILVGVAVSYLFNSLNMLLMVTTDSESMQQVATWLVGSFAKVTWDQVPVALAVTLSCSIVIYMVSNKLNIISMDDTNAKTLGVNVDRLRIFCLVIVSIMISVITAYVGIVGFVGLVAPHIVRSIIEADNRFVIPASALFSGMFLLTAEIIARLIAPNGSIPMGVVMSFIGAPIFLYLVSRRYRRVWT